MRRPSTAGTLCRVSGDEEAGSEDRDDPRSLAADHRRSGWLHLTKEERTEVWLYIVLPQVVFWLLLLFAPASSWLGWGERIGLGASVTAVLVPLMLVRIKN
jgi:hypothetical protein